MDVIVTNKNPELDAQIDAAIIAEYGSFKGLFEANQAFMERYRRMVAQGPELLEKYPDRWIGITPDETLVVGDSMAEVLALLDQAGAKRSESIVEFLNTKPGNLKL